MKEEELKKSKRTMKEKGIEISTPLSTLPSEILEEILSRLPVHALYRFRCVSKSWWDLVADPTFIKMHFNQSLKNNPKMILASKNKLFSMDYEARDGNSFTELNLPCGLPLRKINLVRCCNGLICFNDENAIYVWNPATREHTKLIAGCNLIDRYHVAFGYNPITSEYKVLKFEKSGHLNGEPRRIDVLTLGEKSWRRRLWTFPYILYSSSAALLNGVLHWVAIPIGCSYRTKVILCFDFRDEKLREMPLPDSVNGNMILNVSVLGGLLCIFCHAGFKSYFELWVMKEYGYEKSWTKQFSNRETQFTRGLYDLRPLGFRRSGEILAHDADGRFTLYDPVSNRTAGHHFRDMPYPYNSDNYFESLVSPMADNVLQGK